MTVHELVQTLEDFRTEYNPSLDPGVRKLCGFVTNTIDVLNSYERFFIDQKGRVERSQSYYTEVLEVLDNLVGDANEDLSSGDAVPSLDDLVGGGV